MRNAVYEHALAELRELFGTASNLESNGARFQSRGAVTVYHANVAPGNAVEIAFNIESIARHFATSASALNQVVRECAALTRRDVQLHSRFRWPRVGINTIEQVDQVKARLAVALAR